MRALSLNRFLARVRVCSPAPGVTGLADGVLLQRFLDGHDEAAFEEIVRRHGPMVLAVCRRRLGHEHDAEEAFQATFLLLACKAGSVVPRQQVGAWLHGVACRAASQAARSARRRQHHERCAAELPRRAADDEHHELREVIDEEVARLPERYRAPLVLCLLEGRTPREAAALLGWPEGSVSGRLTRAKRLLGRRLERRGYGLAGATLAAPAVSAERLASAAMASAARLAGPDGVVPVPVVALMQEVCREMWRKTMQKLLTVTLALALAGASLVAGLAGAAGADDPEPPARAAEPAEKAAAEKLPKTAPPTQVLARLADDELVVTVFYNAYEVRQEAVPGTNRVLPVAVPVSKTVEKRFAASDVKIQNTKGKAISKLAVEKLFKKDRLAVAALDGNPVDPLHLRILKDDVPVLILPAPPAPPMAVVPPAAVAPKPVMGLPIAPFAVPLPATPAVAPPAVAPPPAAVPPPAALPPQAPPTPAPRP